MKLLRRIAVVVVLVAIGLYAAVVGYMYANQRALQYAPQGSVFELADANLPGAEKISIPSGDAVVNGWFQAPAPGKPLIVYFKGNSDSFSQEYERYEHFAAQGYGFVAFDYRGFPASPGTISQDNILEDATAVFDWAAGQGFPLVIWGRSLGTGPATYVASIRDAQALLLETPFLSAVTVAGERYPILPVRFVMQDQFPVNEWIRDVQEPVFIGHGTGDTTIDVSNGERLFELVPNPSELWIEPGAGHSDLWARGIWERAKTFFGEALSQ